MVYILNKYKDNIRIQVYNYVKIYCIYNFYFECLQCENIEKKNEYLIMENL